MVFSNFPLYLWKFGCFILIGIVFLNHGKNKCGSSTIFAGATSDNPLLTFESLYENGVDAYLENNWASCISYLELALNDWEFWNNGIIGCREKCYDEANIENAIFPSTDAYEYERVFEKLVRNTLCLLKCKKQMFGSRLNKEISSQVVEDFNTKKPYDYLQLCYYKHGQLEKAANAAVTFLAIQPDHEIMQANLKYYIKEGGLNANELMNLELKEFAREFLHGDVAYKEEKFGDAIEHFEKSLTSFWLALKECRLGCEEPFNQGWHPDFVSSISNHYTYTLRCKVRCPDKLSSPLGEENAVNFLASIFHYLQYSYYKNSDLRKACAAVETYLALIPRDSVQLENRDFFLTQEGARTEFFAPNSKVIQFLERKELEGQLVEFIDEGFLFINEDLAQKHKKEISESAAWNKKNNFMNFEESPLTVSVIAGEMELGGRQRALADGLLTKKQCSLLTNLALFASVEGDGYAKKKNPHTQHESFQGVTLSRAAMMVHSKYIASDYLRGVLNLTNYCKEFIERHFQLKNSLYHSFTHLVCRSAIGGSSTNRSVSDLSHALHADNCILQTNGMCFKIPPAYTYRDYSAILYLKDDFEGGEFIFSTDAKGTEYESIIKPKCGHLLAFSSGKENLHGVKPVLKGRRCAVAMWFTFSKKHKEVGRVLAENLLIQIRDHRLGQRVKHD